MEEEDQWGMEKYGVLQQGGNGPRNGTNYALDQYKTLTGNRIWRIE